MNKNQSAGMYIVLAIIIMVFVSSVFILKILNKE